MQQGVNYLLEALRVLQLFWDGLRPVTKFIEILKFSSAACCVVRLHHPI